MSDVYDGRLLKSRVPRDCHATYNLQRVNWAEAKSLKFPGSTGTEKAVGQEQGTDNVDLREDLAAAFLRFDHALALNYDCVFG